LPGTSGSIPIENIYYLFCYAWKYFPAGRVGSVAPDIGPTVPTMLANLLVASIHDARRRGLQRGYIAAVENTPRLRGRLLFARSISANLLSAGRALCEFDVLSVNIHLNQIVKATLRELLRCEQLDSSTRSRVREALACLGQISDVQLTRSAFGRVQLQPGNRIYFILFSICRLLFDCLLPSSNPGHYRFSELLADDRTMAKVFQMFVRNFFSLEQREFQVYAERMKWAAEAEQSTDLQYLPTMLTDVSLKSASRSIIVEWYLFTARDIRIVVAELHALADRRRCL
jgi:5-methylcytosine-specific restriction enzyme subunit McrC